MHCVQSINMAVKFGMCWCRHGMYSASSRSTGWIYPNFPIIDDTFLTKVSQNNLILLVSVEMLLIGMCPFFVVNLNVVVLFVLIRKVENLCWPSHKKRILENIFSYFKEFNLFSIAILVSYFIYLFECNASSNVNKR